MIQKLSKVFIAFACMLFIFSLVPPKANAEEKKVDKKPVVVLETTLGDIKIELYPEDAPVTVENFLWYVENKFYEGLIFHRVKPDFMVQGGGFNMKMKKKEGNAPIKNEATNGLSNDRGTIAMARTAVINSATSQFFINLVDNKMLNHRDKSPQGYGYAVFGKVIDGMDVVDKIAKVETQSYMGYDDVPVDVIEIEKAYVVKEKKKEKKE